LRLGAGIAGLGGVALSQIANVGPDMGQGYIVDSFMVVVLGGVGQLAGAVWAALGLGIVTKFLEGWSGCGDRQDRRAGVHHHVHPEASAGPVRPQGPLRRILSTGDSMRPLHARPLDRRVSGRAWIAQLADGGVDRRFRAACRQSCTSRCRPRIPAHVSTYVITLIGKILCYAIVAVAMDLIWGYGGILSLGHGLFFALGGYAFGMYLMRQIGRDGSYQSDLPDFMVFLDWKELPWFWVGSDSFLWVALLVLVVPALIAFVFGYFAFRSRIKGVYFSIITQALTYAAMLFFFRNETGFGGNNGFTDFKRILGYSITAPETRVVLFALSALALLGDAAARALPGDFEIRPHPDGDPRCRIAGDVHRLQPAVVQAFRVDLVGSVVRRCRRTVCAAGGNHQPVRNVGRQFDRNRHMGRRRRARDTDRPSDRRVHRQSREELVYGELSRILAVLSRHPVHRRDAVSAAGRRRPVLETTAGMKRDRDELAPAAKGVQA
jgi:ABC-type branched-subunit amino acid transport system permease subunit